jgi:hypothetical protein
MRADLHTHSSRSDGVLSPAELVREAQRVGLDCLALTDHDSVNGIEEAKLAATDLALMLVVGVELSVRDADGVEDHLLGFFIDPGAPSLQAYLGRLQDDRVAMAEQTIQLLERLGAPVSRVRVAELAKGAVVTRPHIARALVEAGHVQSEQEAFERYLGSGKPASPKRPSPDPPTAIAAMRAAGGATALAHPVFSHDADAADRLAMLAPRLDAMVEAGLQAIECSYPDATPELSQQLTQLAQQRHLIQTGGSDYHGPGKAPYVALGSVTVDGETVQALKELAT